MFQKYFNWKSIHLLSLRNIKIRGNIMQTFATLTFCHEKLFRSLFFSSPSPEEFSEPQNIFFFLFLSLPHPIIILLIFSSLKHKLRWQFLRISLDNFVFISLIVKIYIDKPFTRHTKSKFVVKLNFFHSLFFRFTQRNFRKYTEFRQRKKKWRK